MTKASHQIKCLAHSQRRRGEARGGEEWIEGMWFSHKKREDANQRRAGEIRDRCT